MEAVRAFNNELSSLYEVRPPISKAKMTQITKCAIKGIKFYKHIVQSVEKFIQKCRPEYKVPGLYVVDSIVRQSRHQFGADKDVFAPRFTKNITLTFQNLFKCAEEDRPKIVRVLNLWQKNNVFPSDVVQPLMDMANPNTSDSFQQAVSNENILPQNSKHKTAELASWKGWSQPSQVNEESLPDSRSYMEMSSGNLEKFTKGDNSNLPVREDILTHLPQISSQLSISKTVEVKPLEENTVKFNKKLLDFDYGDEEDEEEKPDDGQLSNEPNALALSMAQNLLSNPELLRQLQQMQQTIQQNEALKSELALQDQDESSVHEEPDDDYSPEPHNSPTAVKILPFPELHQQDVQYQFDNSAIPFPPQQPPPPIIESLPCEPSVYQQPILPQEQLILQNSQVDEDERIMHSMPGEPPLPPCDLDERPQVVTTTDERQTIQAIPFPETQNLLQYQFDNNAIPFPPPQQPPPVRDAVPLVPLEPAYQQPVLPQDHLILQTSQVDEDERIMYSMPGEPPLPPHDLDERPLVVATEERVKKERSRSRSRSRTRISRHRSRSKSPRRRKSRSRSGSRSRSRRRDRSRSRDRERERERERQREKEREREREREKERERRRKGIPSIKKNCMSVCSTTLWLGHVPKTLSESEISSTFGEYGSVSSIDMIPPRGCAYVCMDRRQDAFRALQKLKNLKLQGSTIKMAWAPGKGMKGKEYKEYWEVELGVSYIPYEKIPDDLDELDFLEEGGSIDEDSMPEHLRELRQQREKERLAAMEANKPKEMDANDNLSLKEGIPSGTMLPSSLLPPTSLGIPMVLPQMMQPQFGMHLPGLMPHQAMVMQVPMGVPPPNPLMMVQPPSQTILGGQPLPVVGTVPQMPPMPISIPTALPVSGTVSSVNTVLTSSSDSTTDSTAVSSAVGLPISSAGDATPTDEDGTSVSTPAVTSTVQTLSAVVTAISLQSSLPQTGTQPTGSLAQFSSLLGLHGTGRPLMTVPPPVSTAGAPIPFPPPHVGFGFPPPPIRPPPGQAQGLPTVASLPNSASFSWLPKSSTPGFGNFADSELRFGSTVTSTAAGNVRPVAPPIQQSGLPPHMFGIRHPMFAEPPPSDQPTSVAGSQSANSNSSDMQSRLSGSAIQKNKDGSATQSGGIEGDIFGSHLSHDSTAAAHGGPNANHSPMKGFQLGGVSPRSQQEPSCGDTSLEEQEEPPHDPFAPTNLDMACHLRDDLIIPPNARFPSPMDFHHGRVPMDHLWMRGPPPGVMPGPRFPRGMHPPFARRMGGPRGMPPRMEMQFPRHQGPRGPRMHMGGPRGPRRNGPLLQTPPRHSGGREWFSGRREFYDNAPFEREEHDRRFRQKGDWDREREDWDQAENDKGWEMPDMDWEQHHEHDERMQDNASSNDQEKVEKDGSDRQSEREAKPPERPRPPETYMQDDKDWSKDMFRLQFYSRDKENEPRQHEKSHSNRNRDSGRDRNHHEHENKESRDHGAGHESTDVYDNRNAQEHSSTDEHANVHDHGSSRDRGERGNSRDRGERGNSRDRGERGNSRDRGERGNSRDRGERGNSRDRGERGNSRDRGERGNSRDRGERGNSRDRGERGNSRDRGERGNSRDRGEGGNSRDRGEHSTSRDRGERGNSRDRGEHNTSRDRDEARERGDSRDRGSARDRDLKNSRDRGRDRDTRERKRSRWGRTLSQERELQQQQQQEQQQQQSEIEQNLQNNEVQPVLVEQTLSSDIVAVQDVLPTADNLDNTNTEDKEISNGMDDSTEPVVLAPVVAES